MANQGIQQRGNSRAISAQDVLLPKIQDGYGFFTATRTKTACKLPTMASIAALSRGLAMSAPVPECVESLVQASPENLVSTTGETFPHQFGIDHSRFSTKFQGLD